MSIAQPEEIEQPESVDDGQFVRAATDAAATGPEHVEVATAYDAILLASFGGPEGQDDVIPFLRNVTRGRGIPDERLEEVAHHYRHFGGVSPINDQNRELKAALEAELARRNIDLPVLWGNRNWNPYLREALVEAGERGYTKLIAIGTSAYSSYSSCRQYREDYARALAETGLDGKIQIDKVRQFFDHPGFVEPFVDGLRGGLAEVAAAGIPREQTHVLFTTHSIPSTDAEKSGPAARGFGAGGAYAAQHLAVAEVVIAAQGTVAELVEASNTVAPAQGTVAEAQGTVAELVEAVGPSTGSGTWVAGPSTGSGTGVAAPSTGSGTEGGRPSTGSGTGAAGPSTGSGTEGGRPSTSSGAGVVGPSTGSGTGGGRSADAALTWDLVYQSRSGPPTQPWLEPDINDAIRELQASGIRAVVIVPLGFVSDHMEVKWDLDTEAMETAEEVGVLAVRVPTPGVHAAYVSGLIDLVLERRDGTPASERPHLTDLGPWYDVCRPGCCENVRLGFKPAVAGLQP